MSAIKTGDKELDTWIKFFISSKMSMTKFMSLLAKKDKSYLTKNLPLDIDNPLNKIIPDLGLLENDFKIVAFETDSKEKKHQDAKTRLIMAFFNHTNFEPWRDKYGLKVNEVLEKSIIEGEYEQYNIAFEKVISLALKKDFMSKDDFMGVALLRGMLLGSRYGEDEKVLQKIVKKNKIKIFFGI